MAWIAIQKFYRGASSDVHFASLTVDDEWGFGTPDHRIARFMSADEAVRHAQTADAKAKAGRAMVTRTYVVEE